MAEAHRISPLLAVPNEVLYQIAEYLPRHCVVSLQQTCHAFHLPLQSLLVSKHKNDMLLFAAQRSSLTLLTTALSAGADVTYRGTMPAYSHPHFRNTALHRAATEGCIAIITELLRYNPPLEDRGGNDEPPLHSAAWRGHQAAVDLLLAAGCDRNALGRHKSTLLLAAIVSNLEPTATACIDQMGERELNEAIKRKNLTITNLMFAQGIATTVSPPLHIAVSSGLEYVKLCLAHGAHLNSVDGLHKCTALSVAVAVGKTDIVDHLLAEGADPNIGPKKYRPIMNAVYRANTDMVRRLLEHGVDLTMLRNHHADVLVCACERSSPTLVALLLDAEQGLDVDGSGKDMRKPGPLHVAAEHGNVGVIQLLLKRGAKVNARRGPKLETPLHWAARATRKEAVEALLKGGADTQLQCNAATALLMANRSWASVEGRGRTMAALVRGGADINELGTKSKSVVNRILAEG